MVDGSVVTNTRSQAAVGEGLLICGMPDSMLTKSRTADKGGRKTAHNTKNEVTKCYKWPRQSGSL
jgi:hypothetical protein